MKYLIIILVVLLHTNSFAFGKDVNFIQSINPKVDYHDAKRISEYSREYSRKYNLEHDLVLAVMATESVFKKTAKTNKSTGIMQINHNAWKRDEDYKKIVKSSSSLKNPKTNIEAGCLILSKLKEKNQKRYVSKYLGERNYAYLKKVRDYRKEYAAME